MTRKEISLFFSSDHDRIDELFTEFHKNKEGNPEKAKEYFHKFQSRLCQHLQWEEEVLFPLFATKTGINGYGPCAVMAQEHHHIQECLNLMAVKLARQEFISDQEEDDFFLFLKKHNHKEEYILYPVIDELTTLEERKKVLERMGTPFIKNG